MEYSMEYKYPCTDCAHHNSMIIKPGMTGCGSELECAYIGENTPPSNFKYKLIINEEIYGNTEQ